LTFEHEVDDTFKKLVEAQSTHNLNNFDELVSQEQIMTEEQKKKREKDLLIMRMTREAIDRCVGKVEDIERFFIHNE
jgi:hypothetical protein